MNVNGGETNFSGVSTLVPETVVHRFVIDPTRDPLAGLVYGERLDARLARDISVDISRGIEGLLAKI